jgi:hypothetical protein
MEYGDPLIRAELIHQTDKDTYVVAQYIDSRLHTEDVFEDYHKAVELFGFYVNRAASKYSGL